MKNQIMKKYFDKCTTRPKKYIHPAKACIIGYKNENVEIAIIGDSFSCISIPFRFVFK